ncbi:MAG: family acetyltransferase [Microvirga sp.]|jgi:GNAT superfamily N-acetyltransferase|nr:family acetyltransferase [Microvirga sp.]
MTSPDSIPLSLEGYTDIPPGKVASIVTYLEMHEPPAISGTTPLGGYSLERLTHDLGRYRTLFAQIGEPWLWFGRAVMDDASVSEILCHPDIEAFALVLDGVDIGLLELDFRAGNEVELAYFGLVPGTTGKGIGRVLMEEAIRRAFDRPVKRFFVHTCSLDHPGAVTFYVRSGFRPYKRAVEIADDPRLEGFLPLTCAPQVPIIHPRDPDAQQE